MGFGPLQTFFRQLKRGSDADVRTFCSKKKRFYGVSAWKKGLRRAEAVRTKVEEGQIFVILCRRILWMEPKLNLHC